MRSSFQFLLVTAGLSLAACAQPLSTPSEFTQEVVATFRAENRNLQIEIARDLELRITDTHVSLQRIYHELYLQDPSEKDSLISEFVGKVLASLDEETNALNPAQIVPVIKRREWLERREVAVTKPVHEDFSSDLVVVYAQDQPTAIRYLSAEGLEKAGVARKGLRSLAVENLIRILSVESHGGSGRYMLTAGGDYEASLILADSVLKDYQARVKGDLVVAIPTADLFLLGGSDDEASLSYLRSSIAERTENRALTLSPQLFLYKDGKLSEMGSEDRAASEVR